MEGTAGASRGPGSPCSPISTSAVASSPRDFFKGSGRGPACERPAGRPALRGSEHAQGRTHVAIDGEEAVQVRGPEDRLQNARQFAEAELAPGPVDPPLQEDQLAQERTRDQLDPREI